MLSNLLFSVNVVLPIFIMILLGFLGARAKILEKTTMDKMAKITFNWFLSVKIALSTYDADLRNIPGLAMSRYCMIGLAVMFLIVWFLAHLFLKRRESVGSFVHCATRGSITVLGLSLAYNLAGDAGVAMCAPLVAFGSIENNVMAVICLTKTEDKGTKAKKIAGAVLKVLKNPMILGAAAGVLLNLLRIPLPKPIRTPLDYLAELAVPLSLLCIGAALDPKRIRGSVGYAWGAALIKTLGMALIMLPVAVLLGFRGTELALIGFFFMLANPSGVYVMTLSMDGDAELAAAATVLSTFLSIITITLMLYVLKTLGLI